MDKGEVQDGVDLAEHVVLRDDFFIKVSAVK
jgi:hypothetical protein